MTAALLAMLSGCGRVDSDRAEDLDGDSVVDADDACPDGLADWMSAASTDFDGDGCNDEEEDSDDDNDGVADTPDPENENPGVCADVDDDGCDDCAIGVDGFGPLPDATPASDGPDFDADGICDVSDPPVG